MVYLSILLQDLQKAAIKVPVEPFVLPQISNGEGSTSNLIWLLE